MSAGIIIRNDAGQILMMDRAAYPYGWACPAGHVDEGETPEQAVIREAKEETNIDIVKHKLLLEEFVEWNECVKGEKGHYWYLYEARDWKGEIKKSEKEAKDMQWLSPENIKNLELVVKLRADSSFPSLVRVITRTKLGNLLNGKISAVRPTCHSEGV